MCLDVQWGCGGVVGWGVEGDRKVNLSRPPSPSEGKRSYITGDAEGGYCLSPAGGRTDGSFPTRRSREAELHTHFSPGDIWEVWGDRAAFSCKSIKFGGCPVWGPSRFQK